MVPNVENTAVLKSALSGDLILPHDDDYNEARQIWNGMFDKKPGIIVRCKNTSDVANDDAYGRSSRQGWCK